MERADEPARTRTAALGDADPAVPAGVLERSHPKVLGAHHDDRLVEDLVLGEVTWLGDLLQAAGHLPDPGPQVLGLQPIEVRVEISLFGHAVEDLYRVGHREG